MKYEIRILNHQAFVGRLVGYGSGYDIDLGPYRYIADIVEHVTSPEIYVDDEMLFLVDGHPDDDGMAIAEIVRVEE